MRDGDKFRLLCVVNGANKTGTMSGGSTHGRVRFVIALKTNGPLRFELLHAIEAGF